jgi:hypothetical protein
VDVTRSVGARLAALSLDAKGRLVPQLLPAIAVRCGLLVDLAVAGRLSMMDDSVELDPRPTGFPPTDRLLAAMEAEPDRALDSWFDERRFGLDVVADALVEHGDWQRSRALVGRPRHRVSDPGQRDRDLRLELSGTPTDWEPSDVAVAALGGTAHLIGEARGLGLQLPPPDVPEAWFEAVGAHAWLLRAAVDHLRLARARYVRTAAALGSGGTII